jgi:hypothetical protein
VQVSGPGFSATTPGGSAAVCPGVTDGGVCTPAPGAYVYQLVARDGLGGEVVRSVTLVVT